jgi:hypothetical protein
MRADSWTNAAAPSGVVVQVLVQAGGSVGRLFSEPEIVNLGIVAAAAIDGRNRPTSGETRLRGQLCWTTGYGGYRLSR